MVSSINSLFLQSSGKLQRAFLGFISLVLLSLVSFSASATTTAVENGAWEDVANATIEKGRRYYIRGKGYYVDNTIVVADDAQLADSLRLMVSNNSHVVIDPDSTDENGHSYFDVASESDVTRIFFKAKRKRFNYTVQLQQFVVVANTAPVADAQSVITDEDTAASIILTGNDIDGDALSFTVTEPANGTLSGTAPNMTYLPNSGFTGNDSFDFTVDDSNGGTAIANVNITVNAVATRPAITVMGYNIMQLPVQNWDQSQRAQHVAPALLAHESRPDVIAFSEVLTDESYTSIQALKPTYDYITPVLGEVCSGGGWDSISGNCSNSLTIVRGGIAIASKHPILEQHGYVFESAQFGTADYQANKGAVYAKISIEGYIYHVLATHTQATHGGSTDSHAVRVQQTKEIRTWVDSLGIPADEPVILAGDFNVTHDNVANLAEIMNDSLNATLWFDNGNDPDYVHSYPEDNWMGRAYNYYFEEADPCYNKTLDYVVSFNGYLQPSEPAQMDVIQLKDETPYYWGYLDGYWYEHSSSRQGLCATGTGFTDRYSGEVVTEGYFNGYYSDLSDHYPVVATYKYD